MERWDEKKDEGEGMRGISRSGRRTGDSLCKRWEGREGVKGRGNNKTDGGREAEDGCGEASVGGKEGEHVYIGVGREVVI